MSNDLQDLMNTYIMPLALPVLRESCMMPALVSRNYDAAAAEKNAVIRVPLPQNFDAPCDMDPTVDSASDDLSDDKVDITLNRWRYKQFAMSDLEMRESVTSAILPSAAEAAIKSIANDIDRDLLALYTDIPYSVGTFGQLPASDVQELLIDARKVMSDNLAPVGARAALLNTGAEASMLKSVAKWATTGPVSTQALRDAALGRLFGYDSFVDQLMPFHTSGTATADVTSVAANTAATAVALPLTVTGTHTVKKGDIFTIAGVTTLNGAPQPFTVTADAVAIGGAVTVAISPPLPSAVTASAGVTWITYSASHTTSNLSLAFSRDAFMLAMRPLADAHSENSTISVATDPVSGIPLRCETWRIPGKATRVFRFEVLFGVKTLRPELACRVWG